MLHYEMMLMLEERKKKRALLPSGGRALFDNRLVSWALFYLKSAGPIESTRRGLFKITQKGSSEVLAEKPDKIDLRNFSLGFLGPINL